MNTFYLAGDSTMADYPADRAPMQGWGRALIRFLPAGFKVVNEAMCGRSSRSFMEEGRLDRILRTIGEGDYLLIQFGHNDEKDDPDRHTSPWSSYAECLLRYIDGARTRGARPILITPLCRRHFDADGLLKPTHGDYPRAMEALAVREGVPLIDLTSRSAAAYKEMGDRRSRDWFTQLAPGEHPNYPEGIEDDTHLNERGAEAAAELVADGLRTIGIPGIRAKAADFAGGRETANER
ncbi:rhamnogalacturonan acetylesterase [Saccharibacillus alkalitolerans]|uniref:Rhamnogalacturonan acetylesterase n=1 Tax=Saccharibacillus alkalitolerans TaxID=2705290 RepID=A0ABX0F5I7_9BACL|nr:rhamnogalacturonan acetylesterase [Saccharibacillus alkalitolerans]NGZ74456.1 rhamnogalacturonan acetylesterase [Saccharibacillus alkalitolerans]